ncbi:hypothetical protein PS15m_008931 [Mucor circinelloides]
MLVDECSMLTGTMVVAIIFFALIQATDRNVAFGGIAVVFFGDVGQLLPPKSKNYIWKSSLFLSGYKYCLKECKRQKQDEGFQSILQMLRKCQVDDADMKVRARDANREAIDCVNGLSQVFPAVNYPARNANGVAELNFDTNLPERLFVKVGTQVMVVARNLDAERGGSNGALAQVIAIGRDVIELQHKDNQSRKLVCRIQKCVPGTFYSKSQFPIVLAYASTVLKYKF